MAQPAQPVQPTSTASPETTSSKKVARPESVHASKLITKNRISKILTWGLVILIFAGVGYGGYYTYKLLKFQPVTQSEKIELNIDPKIKDQIRSTVHYGESLSPAEGGIGRADPFATY